MSGGWTRRLTCVQLAQRIMQQATTGEPLFVFSRSGDADLLEQANTLKQVMGY